jgi:hypothetical protein
MVELNAVENMNTNQSIPLSGVAKNVSLLRTGPYASLINV